MARPAVPVRTQTQLVITRPRWLEVPPAATLLLLPALARLPWGTPSETWMQRAASVMVLLLLLLLLVLVVNKHRQHSNNNSTPLPPQIKGRV